MKISKNYLHFILLLVIINSLAQTLQLKMHRYTLQEYLGVSEQFGVKEIARKMDPDFPVHPTGYDGQFYFAIAHDLFMTENAIQASLDSPSYRYQRIIMPLLAKLASFNQPRYFLTTFFVLNLTALCAGTIFLFLLAKKENISPITTGLGFLCNAGLFSAMIHTLPDLLALALVAGGIFFWRSQKTAMACIFWASAGLTKETSLLIPWTVIAWETWQSRRSYSKCFKLFKVLSMSTLPFLLWYVIIKLRLGYWPIEQSKDNLGWPFLSAIATINNFLSQPHGGTGYFWFFSLDLGVIFLIFLGFFSFIRHPSFYSAIYFTQALFIGCLGPAIWDWKAPDHILRASAPLVMCCILWLSHKMREVRGDGLTDTQSCAF